MTDRICRKRVLISGRVQGVGFRWYAHERASSLGLSGWIRNLPDRMVEAVFQGEEALVDDMVEWCRRGSPAASVKSVTVRDEPVSHAERGFSVE
ncbi:MAG: acylphosphatase [Synergistaceae bacterium]|jgi:acylphosphatase|nr:acylphosphatase [Synergistaceae bacterium]